MSELREGLGHDDSSRYDRSLDLDEGLESSRSRVVESSPLIERQRQSREMGARRIQATNEQVREVM